MATHKYQHALPFEFFSLLRYFMLLAHAVTMSSSMRPRNLSEAARLDGGPESVATKRRRLAADIARASQQETPYGHVVKTLTIQEVVIPYICPFAMLWASCNSSVAFASFLFACLGNCVGRIALYVDEVVPGNNLRPDHARAFYSVFWLFLEFPDWFRSSAAGWYDLCTIKVSDVAKIDGGISAIVVHLMKLFWGIVADGAWNMETLGLRVAGPRSEAGPQRWILHAKFAVFLVDERAEKSSPA